MNKQSGFIGIVVIIIVMLGLAGGIYLQKTGKIDVFQKKDQQVTTTTQDIKVDEIVASDTSTDQNIVSVGSRESVAIKEQKNSAQVVNTVSERDQLFVAYNEAVSLLKRRNMDEIFSYLKILNQWEPSDSFELDLERWQKYPQEFYGLVDQSIDFIGVNFITKEKFNSGTLSKDGNMARVVISNKQGSVYTLFFVNINNKWYLFLPIV